MKRFLKCILAIALALSLCGCDFLTFSVEELLNAPIIADEQTAIYQALVAAVGKGIAPEYPRSGQPHSAFIITNLDDEPTDEALVFYSYTQDDDSNVYIGALDKNDGEWSFSFELEGKGATVDKVYTNHIGDITDIVVSYGSTGYEGTSVIIYRYYLGALAVLYESSCSAVELYDIDGCGIDEIVSVTKSGVKGEFVVIKTTDGVSYQIHNAPMLSNVILVSGYTFGKLNDTTTAFYADVVDDTGYLYTEMVYLTEDGLVSPCGSVEGLRESTRRIYGYNSCDYDGDGVVEIPTNELFIGYAGNSWSNTQYMTVWQSYDSRSLSLVKESNTYYNIKEEYVFKIPNRWLGVVTVVADTQTGVTNFVKYDSSADDPSELVVIMSVASCDIASDSEKYLLDGYTMVASNDSRQYFVKLPELEHEPLLLTNDEIKDNFYTLSDNG